jgi:hypothetical protein
MSPYTDTEGYGFGFAFASSNNGVVKELLNISQRLNDYAEDYTRCHLQYIKADLTINQVDTTWEIDPITPFMGVIECEATESISETLKSGLTTVEDLIKAAITGEFSIIAMATSLGIRAFHAAYTTANLIGYLYEPCRLNYQPSKSMKTRDHSPAKSQEHFTDTETSLRLIAGILKSGTVDASDLRMNAHWKLAYNIIPKNK